MIPPTPSPRAQSPSSPSVPWRGAPPSVAVRQRPAPPPQPPPPQPRTSPALDSAQLVGRVATGDSLVRTLWRTASRMLSSNAHSQELAELAALVQVPLSTGRRIAVTSMRGGAGKSAVAVLLGAVCVARRADPVLVADADPDGGSLPWRLGLPQYASLSTLAPKLLAARSGELRGLEQLLPRTLEGLWVLPGGALEQPRLARDVTRSLSRLFAVCVTDCGLGVDSPSTVEVLSEAHAVVVVAPATPDGVRTTWDALARVGERRPESLSRVVVAVNTVSREGRAALRETAAQEAFRRFDVPVVILPYDRHLAGGAPITGSRIGEDTLVEATRLAGHALARARQL